MKGKYNNFQCVFVLHCSYGCIDIIYSCDTDILLKGVEPIKTYRY